MATALIWTPRAKEHLNNVLSDLYEISPAVSETWTDELDKKLSFLRWADLFPNLIFIFIGKFWLVDIE